MINSYGIDQRKYIATHLEHSIPLTRIEAENELTQGKSVFAIFLSDIVQNLPYLPVLPLHWIRKANEDDIHWLNQYWKSRYEIDLSQIRNGTEYIVGLELGGYDYTFPENLIGLYSISQN